ncbi:MAG: hypothetical protein M1816_005401 [Peltula sp. TS41687]|nr:MAG: hypothetical protein M1816_005401 [Peltula sp. TS41687]
MNAPPSKVQQRKSPARDRSGRQQAQAQAISRARRKVEDDGDHNDGSVTTTTTRDTPGRTDREKPRRKSIAVNRPGETFTARDRPFSSASHTSLKAAFEATKSLPLEPGSPSRSRGTSRTPLLPSPDHQQHKKSCIPVRARPGQAETPRTTTNGMASHLSSSGWRTRALQLDRGRGSSSSPPRGLREAYARIVDEENLAAEESAMSEMADEFDDSQADWSSPHYVVDPKELRDQDQARLGRIQNSESPLSLPRPRAGSPTAGLRSLGRSTGTNELDLGDSTLDSASVSIISGLSSLENGTDDSFARTLARHARDQQRINGALKTENRVFSRARQPERAGLTSENLRRKDKVDEIMAIEREVAEEARSVTSELSDIPVRVPKDWGRRGRKRNDWLSKIQEAEDAETGRKSDSGGRDAESSTGRVESSQPESSSIDWVAAAADVPLPSVEDLPSHEAPAQQTVTPPPSRQQTSSVERVEQLPLISSKPLIGSKNNVLDRIRDREIEALKDQAVTTNRLGELKERGSKEHLRSRRASGQIGEKIFEEPPIVKAEKKSIGHDSQENIPSLRQEHERDDESESTRNRTDAPAILSNMNKDRQKTDHEKKGEAPVDKPPTDVQPDRRASEQTKPDSRDLLLQLARAASSSPSPSQEKHHWHRRTSSEEAPRSEPSLAPSGPLSGEVKPTMTNGGPAKKASNTNQDAITESDSGEDSTPKPTKGPIESETPALAIGGWVNTPVGHSVTNCSEQEVDKDISVSSLMHDVSSSPLYRRSSGLTGPAGNDDQTSRVSIGLQRTISAPEPNRHPTQGSYRQLEAEIQSTINSIDQLIATNDADIALLHVDRPEAPGLEHEKDQDEADPGRPSEVLVYERVNERLQTLRLSIHDAKKGIEDLEKQVQHTVSTGQPAVGICPQCDHVVAASSAGEHSHWRSFQLPISWPTTHRWKEGSRRPRLTWLGVICLVLGIIYGYYLAERITCELFCPQYVDPNNLSDDPRSHRLGLFTLHYGENYYAVWPPYAIWGTVRWALPGYVNPLAYQLCRRSNVVRSTIMKQTCRELCIWDDCSTGPRPGSAEMEMEMEDEMLWQDVRETDHSIYIQEDYEEG